MKKMHITTIIACAFILILLKIFHSLKNKRKYEFFKQFPSHPTYPVIGNLYLIWGSTKDLITKVDKMMEGYDRLLFWFGSFPMLLFKNHDDIATILSHSQDREILGLSDEWAGIGLLNAKYEEWKKSRRIISPAFNSEMLTKYANVFNKNSIALAKSFKPVAETGETINVTKYLLKANIDIIVENTIGASVQTAGESGKKFVKAAAEAMKNMFKRMVTPWSRPPFIYQLYSKLSGKDNYIKDLHLLPSEILKKELTLHRNENTEFPNDDSCNTILNLLLKTALHEPSFTEERLRNELIQIIFAAIESTALTVGFLMLMLAIYQDIQQKVYEEIVDFLGDSDDTFSSDRLSNSLKYLEQCILETLRMYSPTVATTRRMQKNCVLKDKTIVPADTMVMCLLHWAQRDEKLFENPFKWDPEHFSELNVQNRPKSADLSFGYGARSCIGSKYAMISIKTQIIHILRHYRLSTSIKQLKRTDLATALAIRSKLGFPIKFTIR